MTVPVLHGGEWDDKMCEILANLTKPAILK